METKLAKRERALSAIEQERIQATNDAGAGDWRHEEGHPERRDEHTED